MKMAPEEPSHIAQVGDVNERATARRVRDARILRLSFWPQSVALNSFVAFKS